MIVKMRHSIGRRRSEERSARQVADAAPLPGRRPLCQSLLAPYLCLLISLLLAGCGLRDDPEPVAVHIGLLVPASSELSTVAEAMENSARLAVDRVNGEGGILISDRRHPVILVVADDHNVPDMAVEAARKLIFQDNVQAIIGPATSRTALAVAPIAEAARVPLITPTATQPEVTAGHQFVFRVAFSNEFQGQILAEFAHHSLQLERAAVLYDVTNSYNRGMAEIFQSAFTELGGQIVSMEPYQVGETDFRPMLSRIDAAGAELILLPNFTTDVLLQAQQVRALGMAALLLGSDSWEWQRLALEPALEGAFFSNHFNPEADNPASQPFVTAYQSRYNQLPTGGAALTYDAFQLLFMAMTGQAALEAVAIQEGLAAVTEFRGVTGIMHYDDGRRDPRRSAVILQFVDGQVRYFKLVDP